MAHFVQGLAFLLATAADFSHELHLKLVPKCLTCHSAAATSHEVADNLLPKPEACVQCHQERTIKQPRHTVVARFSHELHVKLGPTIAPAIRAVLDKNRYLTTPAPTLREQLKPTECEGCHRGMSESKAVSAANFPHMADCLVCHNKIDPPDSCATCHSPSTMKFRPANHTADFLDKHTTGKIGIDKTTCAVCHGRRFTCLGCH